MANQEHRLVQWAQAHRIELRAQSQAIEAARRVPAELARQLAAEGFFKMLAPAAHGGGEVDVETMVRVLEELGRGDAAAAWCVMTGATTGLLTAYLPEAGANTIYEDPLVGTAGVFAPMGRAIPVDGGYTVSGQWPFASGCDNSSWRMGGALIVQEGEVQLLEGGKPEVLSVFFPAESSEILDTWSVMGLSGTGSHDIKVENLFVPRELTTSLLSGSPKHDSPLFLFPPFGLLALGITAVGLGIARAAIDEFVQLAHSKRTRGGLRTKAHQELVQVEVGTAEAELAAGRALVFQTVREVWAVAEGQGSIQIEHRARLRMAATQAMRCAVRAIDAMFTAGGGSSIYQQSTLQRHFRDIHTATPHVLVAPSTMKVSGRGLRGVESNTLEL